MGRAGVLGAAAATVLARLVFFVATPALLIATLVTTPISGVFTAAFLPFLASTLIVASATAALARWRWRLDRGEGTVATLCASYANAGYLGIPVAAYVLGDIAYAVPVVLFQVLLYSPVALALLDARPGWRGLLALPLRTPIIGACLLGLAVAASGWTPPVALLRPFALTGAAAVPLALLSLGLSLSGVQPFRDGPDARIRYPVVAAKVIVTPALAYPLGLLLGLSGPPLLAAVVMAGLPTAQNVFVYATRFDRATGLARDAVIMSTLLAAATLTAAALLLG